MCNWAVDKPQAPDEDDSLSTTSSVSGLATGANKEVELRLGMYKSICLQVALHLYSVCCQQAQILRAVLANADSALSTTEDQSLDSG